MIIVIRHNLGHFMAHLIPSVATPYQAKGARSVPLIWSASFTMT